MKSAETYFRVVLICDERIGDFTPTEASELSGITVFRLMQTVRNGSNAGRFKFRFKEEVKMSKSASLLPAWMTVAEAAVWQPYYGDRNIRTRQDVANHYLDLAHRWARIKVRRLPQNIEFNDVFSAAYLSLFKAIERFRHWRGYDFKSEAMFYMMRSFQQTYRLLKTSDYSVDEVRPDFEFGLNVIDHREVDPVQSIIEREKRAAIHKLLDQVIDEHMNYPGERRIIKLHFIEQLSPQEIRRTTGDSLWRVFDVCHRTLQFIISRNPLLSVS